jgi:CO dehydrogenase maturation factor
MYHSPHGVSSQKNQSKKAFVVAVSGKGGVGKTTLSALMLKYIADNYPDKSVLVVDGDPASNIPEVLGFEMDVNKTISKVTYNLKQKIEKSELPPGYDKNLALQAEIRNIIYEVDMFDVLILGRGEGKGCYCFINNLLKTILDPLEESYELIFMDMEAGLEHLSRRTDKNVDELIIVTDMSKMGFNTLERIIEVAKEVHLEFKKFWIVGNRFETDSESILIEYTEELKNKHKINIEFAGFIPQNGDIQKANLKSQPIFNIDSNNPAYLAASKIADKIFKDFE